MNNVSITGNLTRAPETRQAGEYQVVGFGIANNRKRGKKEQVTFLDCEAWGKTGEIIAQYFGKGSGIELTGTLAMDQWQDNDGKNRSKLKLVVEGFSFPVKGGDSQQGGGSAKPASSAPPPAPSKPKAPPISDDDIPF
jgi:single-strand DNA-binding protein